MLTALLIAATFIAGFFLGGIMTYGMFKTVAQDGRIVFFNERPYRFEYAGIHLTKQQQDRAAQNEH